MASPSESKNVTSEETEVTSEHRGPGVERRRSASGVAARELDLEFPLMRQTSIYSLTLDEIQNTVCEPGRTFGSMNMDEFLANIWNVEEGHNHNHNHNHNNNNNNNNNAAAAGAENAVVAPPPPQQQGQEQQQQGLQRQGSLTVPALLSRKTVDEVWAEIHRGEAHVERVQQDGRTRQPTFGEMTLEDFLVKAGVVREGYGAGGAPNLTEQQQQQQQQQQYGGVYGAHAVGMGYGDVHQHAHHNQQVANGVYHVVGDEVGYANAGRMAGNGYGPGPVHAGSPASPGSSEGMNGGQADNAAAAAYNEGMANGRKRTAGGPVERVVERRQRRMIKNRESAARSRARKQAYTVELEAELNQLKEENARLKEEGKRMLALRKQVLVETMTERARAKAKKMACRVFRCNSCSW